MNTIFIDGVEHRILGETGERHGFVSLQVKPADDARNLVHAVHSVPLSWWRGNERTNVRTGGHLYSKNPGA